MMCIAYNYFYNQFLSCMSLVIRRYVELSIIHESKSLKILTPHLTPVPILLGYHRQIEH